MMFAPTKAKEGEVYTPESRGKIIFINASNQYEPHPAIRRLNKLGTNHIQKIVEIYKEFS